MTEKEKKAIEGLKWSQQQMRLGNLPDYNQGHYADIQLMLNLIQKQDTELQQVLKDYQELGKDYHKLECESERKDTEINKLNKELDITKTNYEILQGEMDRIGIDTLHLEAGSSTDDVIDEINKLNRAINKMAEQLAGMVIWNNDKEEPLILIDVAEVIEYFMKEDK